MIPPSIRPKVVALVALGFVLALALVAEAQMFSEDPVSFTVGFDPGQAGPGDVVTVLIKVTVDPPWHIYGLAKTHEYMPPTVITLKLPEGFTLVGKVVEPKPSMHLDASADPAVDVPWHEGSDIIIVFRQRIRLPESLTPGEASIGVRVAYTPCDDTQCLDGTFQEKVGKLVLVAESVGTGAEPIPAPAPEPEPDSGPKPRGEKAATILVVFLGGLASILLPCVYPLIPLTIAFFTKHEGSRASAVGRAILFCLGIVITFTGLGVVLGPAIQALANSMWLNLFLFLLMVVLALSLLGMFDIQLPSSWTGKMQAAGSGASFLAPVAMGVAFSLASFSCTVGVIGPFLVGASEVSHAATRMFAYSVGFALPFFLLALFPVLISAMPKSGGWMNSIKVMLGFFEICFAGYYLWKLDLSLGTGIGSWGVILSLWIAATFVAGAYMLGKIVLPHDSPVQRITVPRAVIAIVCFAAALFMLAGLMGSVDLPPWMKGLLPPAPARTANMGGAAAPQQRARPAWADDEFHALHGGNWWTTDYERARALGREHGQRVLLNFTGVFCSNCRTMEGGLFLDPEVMAEFDGMVLADLYTDIPNEAEGAKFHTPVAVSEANQKLRAEVYGTTANPHYVILSPDGDVIAISGFESSRKTFLEFLRSGK